MDGFMYLIFKFGILGTIFFYIIFAFVVVKQVNRMTDTLQIGFEFPIKVFALLHFLLSVGIFLVGLVIL